MGTAQVSPFRNGLPSVEELKAFITLRQKEPIFAPLYEKYKKLSPGKIRKEKHAEFLQDCTEAIVHAKHQRDVDNVVVPSKQVLVKTFAEGRSMYTINNRTVNPEMGVEIAVFNSERGCKVVSDWMRVHHKECNLRTYVKAYMRTHPWQSKLITLKEFKDMGFKGFDKLSSNELDSGKVFVLIFSDMDSRFGMDFDNLSLLKAEQHRPDLKH